MKLKITLLSFSALLCTLISLGQTSKTLSQKGLYMPRAIKNAYKNGTRAMDGTPGKNYWQNRATYNLKITVEPPNRLVKGHEKIVYTNHSPDTLKRLNFKLMVNAHRPTSPRSRVVPKSFLTPGIFIDHYEENGTSVDWKTDSTTGTDKFVKLQQPLSPGASVTLSIDWHYKVAKKGGRNGAISKNTFFIAYFYPRVAVYDDYNGWDRMPHILAQEFYHDFNNYTLSVTVPKNFIVYATGKLQNPKAVLQPHYAELYKKSKTSDDVIHIATTSLLKAGKVTAQNPTNTWKFKAHNITDVAFAVSNEYNWDAGSVAVGNHRRVSVQAAYDTSSTDFQQMVNFAKHSIKWFSENMPGIPYPYPKMTVVRGFADMEYPMMANDSSHPEHLFFTRFVAEHEISHTFFPFYMGTNETRFGFMDEGWATTFEYLIGIHDLGKKAATNFYQRFRVNRWTHNPSFSSDLPIIIPTNMLSGVAMGNNEYGKASLGYLAVRDLLGAKKFKKVLQGYMERWHGKHPMPWDFFYSFNDLSGKNLNWFWKAWFFSDNYIDYRIESVKTKKGNTLVTLKNVGGFPAPFDIMVTLENGHVKRFHKSPALWKNNVPIRQITLKGIQHPKSIRLQGGIFVDANPADNTWKKQND